MHTMKTLVYLGQDNQIYTDYQLDIPKFKSKLALLGEVGANYRKLNISSLSEILRDSSEVIIINPFDIIDGYSYVCEIIYKESGYNFTKLVPLANSRHLEIGYGSNMPNMTEPRIGTLIGRARDSLAYSYESCYFSTPFAYGIYKLWDGIADRKSLISHLLKDSTFHNQPFDFTKIVMNEKSLTQLINSEGLAEGLGVYNRFRAIKAMVPRDIARDTLNGIVKYSNGEAFPVYYYSTSNVFKSRVDIENINYNTIILHTHNITSEKVLEILGILGLLYVNFKDRPYWTF